MQKKSIATLALLLSCLGVSANAASWLAVCPSARFVQPSASAGISGGRGSKSAPDCRRITSIVANAGARVWRCLPVESDEVLRDGQAGNGFIIQRAGQPLQHLPHDVLPGTENNFELIEVDLNGDAAREQILAVWDGQSNGMGVHQWTIYVFDSGWKLVKRFDDVADWGRSSLVAAPAGRRGCDLAITSYETITQPRGGNYTALRARLFVGRLLSTNAALPLSVQEASDRPTLERRFSRAFERDRTLWFSRGTWQWRGDIANWLNNPATSTKPPVIVRSTNSSLK
jgi:hypothetical protein